MTYDSYHIPIHSPQEGYNLLAKQYKQYHNHLDSFEKWIFQKFLPRKTEETRIIDLWAWDGRLFKYFEKSPYKTYTACDIAQKLLNQHPGNVEKVVCDINNPLPFEDCSYDLALSFFVIEHIANTNNFFEEIHRILDQGGRYILWYFLQKRLFTHKQENKEFRIEQIQHSPEDIQEQLQQVWFNVYREEVFEKDILLWYIRVADK